MKTKIQVVKSNLFQSVKKFGMRSEMLQNFSSARHATLTKLQYLATSRECEAYERDLLPAHSSTILPQTPVTENER
jgi:hypothetical protein